MATAGIPFPSFSKTFSKTHTTTGQGGYFRIPRYNRLPATQLLLPESVWIQSQSSELACRFPGEATTAEGFWELLCKAKYERI